MIHQHYMDPGSFSVPLLPTTPPNLLRKIDLFGHIIITSQYYETIGIFNDLEMRTNARYAGVVLEPIFRSDQATIDGQGMEWWLGDDSVGAIYESTTTFTSASPSTVMSTLFPAGSAIIPGTITATDLDSYDGSHRWQTPMEALRSYSLAVDAHWRVNPNGTIDLCSVERDDVFVVNNPRVVSLRKGYGYDASIFSVPADSLTSRTRGYNYVNRVIAMSGSTFYGAVDKDDIYYDMHGNEMSRTKRVSAPSSTDGSLTSHLNTELKSLDIEDEQEVSTWQFEFHRGNLAVGDMFYIFDPPSGFVDYDNPLPFRGDVIFPKKERLIEARWPIAKGMGVYYRPSRYVDPEDADDAITCDEWINLTPFVDWEA